MHADMGSVTGEDVAAQCAIVARVVSAVFSSPLSSWRCPSSSSSSSSLEIWKKGELGMATRDGLASRFIFCSGVALFASSAGVFICVCVCVFVIWSALVDG